MRKAASQSQSTPYLQSYYHYDHSDDKLQRLK